MALPSLPQRIREFLVSNHGSAYCDVCIQTTLDLNWRQQVQLVTATFSTTEQFERKIGPCFVCNEVKQVICTAKGWPTRSELASRSRLTLKSTIQSHSLQADVRIHK